MVLGSKKLGHLINIKSDRQNEKMDDKRSQRTRFVPRFKRKKNVVDVQDVKIGERIDLRHSPWKDGAGAYPCKVIRRPDFAENDLVKVAGGACARAVAQSTKQHVMIVDRHVVEFTLLNDTIGRIAFVSSVDSIYKMRLRKEEQLIALFFKLGKNDPLILNCNECAIVSQQIRAGRGRGLVKKEAVNKALHLIQEIQAQERALEYQPSQQRVDEIFSLYDRAAEQFELAGEYSRQEEVEEHKMKFLAQPNVTSIMSGTPIEQANAEPKRGVEILETSVGGLGDDVILSDDEPQNWADFEHGGDEVSASKYDIVDESIDDMISETRQDFDAFNIGYEIDSEMNRDGAGSPVVGEGSAFAMQFEAAMTAAERELDEIRKM